MPSSLAVPVLPFLLVLARVGGVFALVPFPGFRAAPEPVRAVFALAVTLALAPRWPPVPVPRHIGQLAVWVLSEAAFGLAIGVVVAMLLEAFGLAAQVFGLQAGYAYASTVDPNTQADSGVLLVVAQLAAGLVFFALGLDREVVRLVAVSLERVPPGGYALGRGAAEAVVRLGDTMFGVALRMAFPVVALLLMADMALALAGKLNQHLQLLSLAFPVKMLCALAVLAVSVAVMPRLMRQSGEEGFRVLRHLLGI